MRGKSVSDNKAEWWVKSDDLHYKETRDLKEEEEMIWK